jgi:hypothetical protein
MTPANHEENFSDEKIIKDLSTLITETVNLKFRDPVILFLLGIVEDDNDWEKLNNEQNSF